MRQVFLATILVIIFASSAWAASNPDGVAVIIGNKAYQGRIPAVDYAHRDAEAIKRYVLDILGFDPDNLIDLRDATQAQMQATFGNERDFKGKLWSYISPKGNSDILIYYSGHGVPGLRDKRGYLLPVDADPDQAEINGYPVDLLYKNIGKLKARSKTVLLEACFSGESPKGMLIRSASPVYITAKTTKVGKDMTVLTAASGNQLASWDEEAQHGFFTEYFLRGVYGAADRDKNGAVTTTEVKDYLDLKMTRAARRTYRREQTATAMGDISRTLSTFSANRPPARPQIASLALMPKVSAPKPGSIAPARPAAPASTQEIAFWESIKDDGKNESFVAYLRQFPNGTFAPLARMKLAAFKRKEDRLNRWNGNWKTSFGNMTLNVTGNNAGGSYEWDKGRIVGHLSKDGRKLTGTWREDSTYTAPDDGGAVEFTLSEDGQTFTGRWWFGDDRMTSPPPRNRWSGERIR